MRLGIIDIGYNAIRAVVHENNTIGAPEIFNNKFKNDILSLLTQDNLDVKHQAYLSIKYILHIFERLGVKEIRCVATAVLRQHPKAESFIEFIKQKFNLTIDIIPGEREAYLTALGLISGISEVNGIAADLGGGSLELVEINDRVIGRLTSLDLGTKVITERNLQSLDGLVNIIKTDYGDYQYENLYLIGGALRFISRFFIEFNKYPLKNLHNLTIPSDDLSLYLSDIQNFQNTNVKIHNRTLNPNAILVAQAMIKVFKPQNIVVSIFGLKEGVRYEMLADEEKNQDIVLQKVLYCTKYDLAATNFDSYYKIIELLTEDSKDLNKLLKIAIILQSLSKYFDPTLPPKAMNEYILNSEIPFTHRQRVMIALIISYSSNFKPDTELLKMSKKFLKKSDFNNSQILGHFIRIAKDVDGSTFTEPSFSISITNNYLEIVSRDILPRPIFEKICERLKAIAYVRKINFNEQR
jgi:exopolyphosphatase/guanosine-5'-triphosphate,3'-diphosphate pyrophosphatase